MNFGFGHKTVDSLFYTGTCIQIHNPTVHNQCFVSNRENIKSRALNFYKSEMSESVLLSKLFSILNRY